LRVSFDHFFKPKQYYEDIIASTYAVLGRKLLERKVFLNARDYSGEAFSSSATRYGDLIYVPSLA
jgi:hypothetical protein